MTKSQSDGLVADLKMIQERLAKSRGAADDYSDVKRLSDEEVHAELVRYYGSDARVEEVLESLLAPSPTAQPKSAIRLANSTLSHEEAPDRFQKAAIDRLSQSGADKLPRFPEREANLNDGFRMAAKGGVEERALNEKASTSSTLRDHEFRTLQTLKGPITFYDYGSTVYARLAWLPAKGELQLDSKAFKLSACEGVEELFEVVGLDPDEIAVFCRRYLAAPTAHSID